MRCFPSLLLVSLTAATALAANDSLPFPKDYREWVYLSSGVNMSYNENADGDADHPVFDNVFVNPEAYRSFQQTGTWPDKTILVLEVRGGSSKGSINQHGSFQDEHIHGIEVHVKDHARYGDGWAFVGFDLNSGKSGLIPHTANCYSCHAEHGTVDTTFVQFYPTLRDVAKKKGTLKEP